MVSTSLVVKNCTLIFVFVIAGLKAAPPDALPPVNAKMIAYVNKVMGKKVDHGECWDLVKNALDNSDANWNPPDDFGKKLDPKKDTLLPGDVVAMKNVSYTSADGTEWKFSQHYAIVYTVEDKEHLTIANQNVNGKRKVIIVPLTLVKIKGDISFFRPQSK